jgi:predicted nucleic acid-binding protein
MKNMVILIDTNVILDFLSVREPYFKQSKAVIRLCAEDRVNGYMAFHSLPNVYYILRRNYDDKQRREMLRKICSVLQVTGASHERVCNAVDREDFSDFEDCLQDECAKEVKADYIVTRNVKDFQHAEVQAVTPEEFLGIIAEPYDF